MRLLRYGDICHKVTVRFSLSVALRYENVHRDTYLVRRKVASFWPVLMTALA